MVRLRAPDQPQTFQLGTAWAISKRRLVTSAAIVTGVRDLQNKLPLVTVFQPGLKLDAQVVSSRVHPQYEPAWRDANAARSEVEQLERELVDPADPNRLADANRLNEIKTQRIAVEERLYQAASRLVAHDVAVLEVSRDLPASLALSDRVTTISPASRVTLATFPLRFQSQDHLVDPEQPPQLVEATGRLMNRVPLDSHPTAGWWRLNVSTDLAEQNCSGSPVLNSRNQVVGLYSRPTPPDRIQPTPSAIHDITEIDRLRDFLPAP